MRLPFDRSTFGRWSLLAAVLGASLAAAPSAQAAGPTREEAEKLRQPNEADDVAAARLNEEGKALVRERKYYQALERFQCALALFPISNAIFNVGSMHYTLKQYADAYPYLEQTLKAPLSPEQRDIVLKYKADVLDKLKVSHRDILVQSNPPGAALTLNGKPLPFPAPQRVLIPLGSADIGFSLPGFESENVVVESSPTRAPVDVSVRLKREEPYANVSIRCPASADVFVDGTMKGFDIIRDRMLAGEHVVRCGKTKTSAAFERTIVVRKAVANNFDFSTVKE